LSVVPGEQIEESPGKGGGTDLTEVTGDQSRKAMDELLDRDAKDMTEEEHTKGERAVSMGWIVGVSIVLGSSDMGEHSEDELGSGVPLVDIV
jgi:hypothetical protein